MIQYKRIHQGIEHNHANCIAFGLFDAVIIYVIMIIRRIKGAHMRINTSKLISFCYWARNIAFAMQAIFAIVLILFSSIPSQRHWLDMLLEHPLFGWTIFFLCVSVITTITIEHLEKK